MLNKKAQSYKSPSSDPFARGSSFGEGPNSADQANIQQTVSDLSIDNARLTKENEGLREQIQGSLNTIADNVHIHRQRIEDGTAKIRELEIQFKAGGLAPSAGRVDGPTGGAIAPPRLSGAMPTLNANDGDDVLDVLRELDSSLDKVAVRLQEGISDLKGIEKLASKRQPPIDLFSIDFIKASIQLQAAPPPRHNNRHSHSLPSPPYTNDAGIIIWVCLSRCQGRTLDMFDAFSTIVKTRSGKLPLRHEFIQAHGKSQLMGEIQMKSNIRGAMYLGINQMDDADSDAFAMVAGARLQVQPVFFIQSEQPPTPRSDSCLYVHFWDDDFPDSKHNDETYNKIAQMLKSLA
ncbi:hypothetical protein HDU97_002892 [Phlyctochytrium planicorne]|nr:hypothetical protein HDU97_002892 [Phlyctochytrium planicorne]